MSVVVRMEMPENCLKCPLHEFGGVCLLKVEHTAEEWLNIDKRRPLNCPILCQLPEGHGDLIDRDTFISKYLSYYTKQEREFNLMFAAVEVKQQFADMICDEQAIVPAERSET